MWIPVHESLLTNRKVRSVSRALETSMPETRGYLVTLWLNVQMQAADGTLDDWSRQDIADAAEWGGDPIPFCDALQDARLIAPTDAGWEVVSWMEYREELKISHIRAQARARKREQRKRDKSRDVTESHDVTQVSQPKRDRSQAVTNVTGDRTGQDRQDRTGQDLKPLSVSKNETDLSSLEQHADGEIDYLARAKAGISTGPPEPDPEPSANGKNRSEEIRLVFDHYRKYHPRAHKQPSSKGKEWKLIRERLEEGSTVKEICDAIDGNHKSGWYQGNNKRGNKYNTLELIVRDGGNVTKFGEMLEPDPMAGFSEQTKSTITSTQEWLDWSEQREAERSG